MAVEFVTDTKRGDALYRAWPEDLVILPELNGRHENTDVEELAADIHKNGQDVPIIIRKDDEGRPVLVAGHRRYRAVCLLNEKYPENRRPLICRYKNLNDVEAFQATIRENRFRRDVSPIDDATNINILKTRFGLTDEDVAAIYFPEAKGGKMLEDALRFVKNRSALIELSPEAAQAVREGRVKITAAVALSKLTKVQQRKKVETLGKVKVSDVLTPKAPKEPKAAKSDKELLRKVHALLEDVVGGMLEDEEVEYIEIERKLLLDLSNYVSGNK